MDMNSFRYRPIFFPYEDEVNIAKPSLTLAIIVLVIAGPFWFIISLIRGTLKEDIRSAMHPIQSK